MYAVEFVRAQNMHPLLSPALLHRFRITTFVYCHADHIDEEMARTLADLGSRFVAATAWLDTPEGPEIPVRFHRLRPDDMPTDLTPAIGDARDDALVAYVRADMISTDLTQSLERLFSAGMRYVSRLPTIAPYRPAGPRETRRGRHQRRGP